MLLHVDVVLVAVSRHHAEVAQTVNPMSLTLYRHACGQARGIWACVTHFLVTSPAALVLGKTLASIPLSSCAALPDLAVFDTNELHVAHRERLQPSSVRQQ